MSLDKTTQTRVYPTYHSPDPDNPHAPGGHIAVTITTEVSETGKPWSQRELFFLYGNPQGVAERLKHEGKLPRNIGDAKPKTPESRWICFAVTSTTESPAVLIASDFGRMGKILAMLDETAEITQMSHISPPTNNDYSYLLKSDLKLGVVANSYLPGYTTAPVIFTIDLKELLIDFNVMISPLFNFKLILPDNTSFNL